MNLGDNFSDSLEYARKLLFSDAGRLIKLIVLSIIPIVNLIVIGYQARVLRESPGTGTPPKLEKYGELFVDGAKVFFAALIYMLIPLILLAVGSSTFAGLVSTSGAALASGFVLGGAGAVILLVGIILIVLLWIILSVGMAHMIKTGKFGKAFAFGEILNIIRGIGWVKYIGWIVFVVIIHSVVVAVLVFTLLLILPVGLLIFALLLPTMGVFVFRSTGLLYNEGAPPELKVAAPVVSGLVCPSCGTPLQPHHKFCPSCGAAVPAPPPTTAQTGTKFCISCGAKIPTTATFCGSCGAKQT